MTKAKVLAVIALYRERFEKEGIGKIKLAHDAIPASSGQVLEHCHAMLDQMVEFMAEGRLEKVFRWLGFIQGCFWRAGWYTLDELKDHNRP
ncbi:MAG: hypothetical protein HY220_00340 [Candidatus Sungbacteria bacterium]|uniref:Uncharacterized protein n=1 Tax=Candidatus Sungiibacteriota bacterium TaxID=2750080 RepID=A0A9D6LQG5_9BACT|nr:hypothetical protein [Candidatus Sungbacteria bacterium]